MPKMPDIHQAFAELTALLPATTELNLLPGLSTQTIEELEAELEVIRPGARLPETLKTLYAICGGQEATDYDNFLFASATLSFTLLPLRTAIAVYRELHTAYEDYFRPTEPPDFARPWFDTRCLPFGWSPGESGCVRCMHLETEKIYFFDDDGGLQPIPEYDDIFAVFEEAAKIHRQGIKR